MLQPYVHSLLAQAALTGLTAFLVSLVFGAWLIAFFRRKAVVEDTSQPDHEGLDIEQKKKKNVPTMGGLMIIAGLVVATLLWCDLKNPYVWYGLLTIVVLGGAGFADDYIKLYHKPKRGLNKKQKLIVQFLLGGVLGYLIIISGRVDEESLSVLSWPSLFLPYPGHVVWNLGMGYVLWAGVVMAATSNAVNLTDGLDGLAGGCTVIAAAFLAVTAPLFASRILSFSATNPAAADMAVMAVATGAAVLGFLWYNAHPAQIFMGDTGSLALGGILAYIALVTKMEVPFFIAGLVFFADELTVALQIASFKLTKRRIFPIAPIHHYFQLNLKWPEQKIVSRAWILGLVSAVLAVLSLACY